MTDPSYHLPITPACRAEAASTLLPEWVCACSWVLRDVSRRVGTLVLTLGDFSTTFQGKMLNFFYGREIERPGDNCGACRVRGRYLESVLVTGLNGDGTANFSPSSASISRSLVLAAQKTSTLPSVSLLWSGLLDRWSFYILPCFFLNLHRLWDRVPGSQALRCF